MTCPPHHFVLEDNKGEYSTGTCKRCGAQTVGRNWDTTFVLNPAEREHKQKPTAVFGKDGKP
jgi:hypothetical protein